MAQRDHRGMTTVRAPVFRLERLNLTVPSRQLDIGSIIARQAALGAGLAVGLPVALLVESR